MAEAEKETTVPKSEVAVVEKKSQEVAAFDEFLGESDGHEDFEQSDFTVPFLSILQALSKPLQRGHEKYLEGAAQGMVLNSATRALYDTEKEGILLVPAFFHHRYVAWKPENGGIAYDLGSDSTLYDSITPDDKNKRFDENGNELVDTMEYFCLQVDPKTGAFEAVVVPFSGTFSKKAKRWNNLIRSQTEMKNGRPVLPPVYFYAYTLKTVPESNAKGSWFSWDVSLKGRVPEMENGAMIFAAARELRASVSSGKLTAAVDSAPADEDDDDGNSPF